MKKKIIAMILVLITILSLTGCASMQRDMKTISSDWSGGLNRTVTVYDYNGNPSRVGLEKLIFLKATMKPGLTLTGKELSFRVELSSFRRTKI